MRKITTLTDGKFEARVYRDSEWDEYITKYYQDGVYIDGDSHTDDKQDALVTAKAVLAFFNRA